MKTYGRKKASVLPSFSVLRSQEGISPSKKIEKKGKPRATTVSVGSTSNIEFERNQQLDRETDSHQDDSIDEMVSDLLDDTTKDRFHTQPGNRMAYVSTSQSMPYLRGPESSTEAVPHLPQLASNGDDALAPQYAMRADSMGKAKSLSDSSPAHSPPRVVRNYAARRGSIVPVLPRRSSKRNSGRLKKANSNLRAEYESQEGLLNQTESSNGAPQTLSSSPPRAQPFVSVATDVRTKVDAFVPISRAKRDADNSLGRPKPVSENKYLSKIKKAFSHRSNKKLAKNNTNALGSTPDANSPGLSTKIVANMRNDKVFKLTGDGCFRRKPTPKSHQKVESLTDEPVSYEASHTSDDESIDAGASIGEVDPIPEVPDTPMRTPSPRRPHSTRHSIYDFDTILTASPEDQSTPRRRLEPKSEENGQRSLRTVPSDGPSMFDLDDTMIRWDLKMEGDSCEGQGRQRSNTVKRKSSQVNMLHAEKLHASKKFMTKKHPSPSKDDLAIMGAQFSQMYKSVSVPVLKAEKVPSLPAPEITEGFRLAGSSRQSCTTCALSPRPVNELISGTTRDEARAEVVDMSAKPELPTTTSMPLLSFPTRPRQPKTSMIPQPVPYQVSARSAQEDTSMLDIDELQWDQATYDIGMKRA